MLNIVLVEPEIPQNTGNIVRSCAATGCNLHLVRPLGFSVEDKYLRRAGLDYWDLTKISYYDSFQELLKKYPENKFYYATTKSKNIYSDFKYGEGDFFVFGKETAGLPKKLIEANEENCIKLPMKSDSRSLNLSNSVIVVMYEALRQIEFPGLT